MRRLAIIVSHPTQYYSPWFRFLAGRGELQLRVFYLWNFGVTTQVDQKFGAAFQWDLPLLEGYEHTFVPNTSPSPGTGHFRGLRNPTLQEELQRYDADAVLLFGHGWQTHATLLTRGAPGRAKLLYRGDSHLLGEPRKTLKSHLRKVATSFLFRNVDQFLAVGKVNADYFRSHGATARQITHVPHCVDNDRFRQQGTPQAGLTRRQELGIESGQPVILFAGKFEDKKRPQDLLTAFLKLNDPTAVLVMAGGGGLESALTEQAGGASNVRFLPFQNQSSMPLLYAAADVFVLPSVGRSETWGLAVNEAMNCGCAIVTSDHVGCSADLVRPGENGLVVQAGNVDELRSALQTTLADRERLEQWKQRSLSIINDYSYKSASKGLMRAMDAVCPARERHAIT